MPEVMKNGIKTDNSKLIARKIVKMLETEKCTVKESNEVLRLAELLLNDSPVIVQRKK